MARATTHNGLAAKNYLENCRRELRNAESVAYLMSPRIRGLLAAIREADKAAARALKIFDARDNLTQGL